MLLDTWGKGGFGYDCQGSVENLAIWSLVSLVHQSEHTEVTVYISLKFKEISFFKRLILASPEGARKKCKTDKSSKQKHTLSPDIDLADQLISAN